MKLQIAIDRVTLSKAEEMAKIFAGKTDIIEMGTSLIKDYGLFALKKLNEYKKDSLLLADLKTCDEGAYEFKQGYEQGFDILTVMGSSSRETLEKCYEVSQSYEKYMLSICWNVPWKRFMRLQILKMRSTACIHR